MIATNTLLIKIENGARKDEELKLCAEIIKCGGLVAFPTETVYGLGCNGLDKVAVSRLYAVKNRPPIKPISLCVSGIEAAKEIAVLSPMAVQLFNAFLPGPLTLVLPKRPSVPDIVTAGLDSVGVRVPSSPVALRLAELCGVPIALPSANLSGQGSLTDGVSVTEAFDGKIDAIIDGGKTSVGFESTIVSVCGKPKILRQGALPYELLKPYLEN